MAFVRDEIWGFPKIRGTLLGVPRIGIIISGGLYWGSHILGNYQSHCAFMMVSKE